MGQQPETKRIRVCEQPAPVAEASKHPYYDLYDEDEDDDDDDDGQLALKSPGLLALPAELVQIIISHIPAVPFPCSNEDLADPDTFARSETLFSLSQCCRWLRANVQRLMWESLEVYTGDESRASKRTRKMTATQLVRKLELVTFRQPIFARRIQSLTVQLNDFSSERVYPEFLRSLSCMTNLRTLQILSFPEKLEFDHAPLNHLTSALATHPLGAFPSVRNLSVPIEIGEQLAPFFPGVQIVHVRTSWIVAHRPEAVMTAFGSACPNLEIFACPMPWVKIYNNIDVFRLIGFEMPTLRIFPYPFVLVLAPQGSPDYKQEPNTIPHVSQVTNALLSMRCLTKIRIVVYGVGSEDFDMDHADVKAARSVLSEMKKRNRHRRDLRDEFHVEIVFPKERDNMLVLEIE